MRYICVQFHRRFSIELLQKRTDARACSVLAHILFVDFARKSPSEASAVQDPDSDVSPVVHQRPILNSTFSTKSSFQR
jgi:hypothetical protein